LSKIVALSLFVSALLTSHFALADEYFTVTRDDQSVPAHCQEPKIEDFYSVSEFFSFGPEGAVAHGFTYEYPQSRGSLGWLWRIFHHHNENDRRVIEQVNRNRSLQRDYTAVKENIGFRDVSFDVEGDVLELLAIVELEKHYSPSEYYITGGFIYHNAHSSGAIGELDLVIARRDNCLVIGVGEAKLGVHRLAKAKEQLARFRSFVGRHH
jgi:hypothetical protein